MLKTFQKDIRTYLVQARKGKQTNRHPHQSYIARSSILPIYSPFKSLSSLLVQTSSASPLQWARVLWNRKQTNQTTCSRGDEMGKKKRYRKEREVTLETFYQQSLLLLDSWHDPILFLLHPVLRSTRFTRTLGSKRAHFNSALDPYSALSSSS